MRTVRQFHNLKKVTIKLEIPKDESRILLLDNQLCQNIHIICHIVLGSEGEEREQEHTRQSDQFGLQPWRYG